MARLTRVTIFALTSLALVACGNGNKDVNNANDSEEVDPIEALNAEVDAALAHGGGEDDAQDEGTTPTEVATTDKPKPKGTGPGQLLLTCKVMGEEIPCDLEIQKSDDLTKVDSGKGKSKYSFSLNPGAYTIQLYFSGAADKPRLTLQQLEIPPGETVDRTVVFPMAKVTFIPVSPTGKKVGGWKFRIKLMGAEEWATEDVKLNAPVYISPGLYEGQLYKGKGGSVTIDVSKIQINEDAITQQPITVTH